MYTALTRHQDRLVILHEGPLVEYRRYAGDEHSEIARRMTNLFADPLPREVTVNAQQRFLEEGLIHRTERGDLVRSKSELVIAGNLHARAIDYAYEQPLVLPNGHTRYPDFTIADHARGVTFYWEHLGMLDDSGYRSRWERKRAEYLECGIGPHEEGGGPEGTLIETRDEPGREAGCSGDRIGDRRSDLGLTHEPSPRHSGSEPANRFRHTLHRADVAHRHVLDVGTVEEAAGRPHTLPLVTSSPPSPLPPLSESQCW